MDKQTILQKLQGLKPMLQEKYGVSELALFGSYSRDEQTGNSDIDIMVDFSKPIGIEYLDVVYLIREAFDDVPVQVVAKKAIKKSITTG
ncbi:MAG: nucleotidyltransferase domain-containing protein [Chitinophagaceae bacterium]|nr:nucleotidyltransferase domain-containing protein [Chitinophagaceae bacterium]